jgi:hypothetical protein
MLNLITELELVIETLDSENIDYAICGGMAMAIHGFIRATVDIDFLVLSKDIERSKIALKKVGYLIETPPMQFSGSKVIIHRLTKTDVDSEDFMVLDMLEVTSDINEIWSNKITLDWNNKELKVVDKYGLISLKKIRNSKIDIEDIERLEEYE